MTEDWLMVVGAILVAWLLLEALAYRRHAGRDAEAEPPSGFLGWLGSRVRQSRPLLALLLVCTALIAPTEGRWAFIGAAIVLAWWVAEAIAVRPLIRTRNPLSLFALAMRRLWEGRWLLRVLVASWIASAAVTHLFYLRWYRIMAAKGEALTASEYAPSTVTVVRSFPSKLVQSLPQVRNLSLGTFPDYLLIPVLAVALIWLWAKRTDWLSGETHKRLRWPLGLTVACALCQGAYLAFMWDAMWGAASLPGPRIADPLLLVAAVVLASPAYALLWHLGLQVARAGRCDLRSALRGMTVSWAAICAVQLLITLPTSIMLLLPWLRISGMSLPVYQLGVILKVVLALAPWIIVDQEVGFRAALVETYRLASRRAYDVLVFALRFTVMFAVPAALLSLLLPRGLQPPTPVSMIQPFARSFLTVAQALVIATVYLELRRKRDPVEDASAAADRAVPQ